MNLMELTEGKDDKRPLQCQEFRCFSDYVCFIVATNNETVLCLYHTIPKIIPGLIFVQKAFLPGLFSEGLILGGNCAFQNELDLTIKTA